MLRGASLRLDGRGGRGLFVEGFRCGAAGSVVVGGGEVGEALFD